MKDINKLQSQLKALEYVINNKLVKNPYSLQGKINNLKKQIESCRKQIAWNNYLNQ